MVTSYPSTLRLAVVAAPAVSAGAMVSSVSVNELVFLWFDEVPAADDSVELSDFDSDTTVR